jgi:hypothetical protein
MVAQVEQEFTQRRFGLWSMVFNATFNNISWRKPLIE